REEPATDRRPPRTLRGDPSCRAARRERRTDAPPGVRVSRSGHCDGFFARPADAEDGQQARHLEDRVDPILERSEGDRPARAPETLRGHEEDPKACAADVVEAGQVEDEPALAAVEEAEDLLLQEAGGAGVDPPPGLEDHDRVLPRLDD